MDVTGETNGRIPMSSNQKNRPTHVVYVVEGEGDSAFWTKVGAAWRHEDGDGFNVTLSVLPLNGRLVVRTAKVDPKKEAGR